MYRVIVIVLSLFMAHVAYAQTSKMNSQLKSKTLSAPRDISKLEICVKDPKQCPEQATPTAKTTAAVSTQNSESFQNGTPTARIQSSITTKQNTTPSTTPRKLSSADSNEKYQPYVQKGQSAVTGGKK